MRDKILAILYIFFFSLLAVLFLIWPFFVHASVTTKHGNSLGVVQYQDNPYMYKAGAVIAGYAVDNGKALVLRIQPIGTYSLFTEDILICNYPIEMLASKMNPMVLTYRTRASKMIQGIGCHELVHVDELKPKELPE
jgi:hypothetical protein